MPILDDEKLGHYLREFHPLPAEPLQMEKQPVARRRSLAWMAWAAACAGVLVLAFLLPQHFKPAQPTNGSAGLAVGSQLANSQTLTIGRANALLVHAPSLKEAFDELSFQPRPASQPQGKQSALAVLSKDNIKENIKL